MRRVSAVLVVATLVVGCNLPKKYHPDGGADEATQETKADEARAKYEADKADAEAQYNASLEAWKTQTRKACHVKPDAGIHPASARELAKMCIVLVDAGLKVPGSGTYPDLPAEGETGGLSTIDGCRYFFDSYVDGKNVLGVATRTRYRCTYDPTIGVPSYKILN
jgi:hypothetical protein